MSEMNSVSDLMATWAKFTLRGGLLGEITVTEMVSWERLLVRFNFFFLRYAFFMSSKWAFYRHWVKVP